MQRAFMKKYNQFIKNRKIFQSGQNGLNGVPVQ